MKPNTINLFGGGGAGLGLAPAGGNLLGGSGDLLGGHDPLAVKQEPHPFDDIEYTESFEENTEKEVAVLETILRAQNLRKQQQDAIELANDTGYWFAVYFQTREQKEVFMRSIDIKPEEHVDDYVDGRELAEKRGVVLPPRPAPYKVGKLDKKLRDLT